MNYSQFTGELETSLKQIPGIPENIMFTQSIKNNGVITQHICIRDGNVTIAPSIGLDYFYDEYLKGRNIDEIAERISEIYFSQPDFSLSRFSLSWNDIKEHVVYHLVNYESNFRMLEKAPHIKILNLALIFKINTNYLNINGYITVNNNIMDLLETNLKALLETAIRNTPKLLPLNYSKIKDSLRELSDFGEPEDEISDTIPLWICTNKEKLYGASCIFYDDLTIQLQESDLFDCYIIPSSIHEILILKNTEIVTLSELEKTVEQVNNSSYVSDTDFLSNSVYTYQELKQAYNAALKELNITH